jgi:hypothetical protein
MRTLSLDQSEALLANSRGVKVRATIWDGVNWQDTTNINGFSFLKQCSWGESVDDPHITASVLFNLRARKVNLSPFVGDSAINKQWNAGGSIIVLVDLGKQLKIEVQFGAAGKKLPENSTWTTVFHGRIDSFDIQGEQMSVSCRDLSGILQDTFIEKERVYGFTGVTKGARVWDAQATFAVNERALPSGTLTGFVYKVTSITTGTTGASEPTWPTSVGGTVVDGGVTWTCEAATVEGDLVENVIQNILNDNMSWFGTVNLYTPTSPAWNLNGFKQNREGVLSGIRRLAQQQGSDVRQKWRAATAQFELTYYTPDRTKSAADRTFAANEYRSITKLGVNIAGIRNVVRVIYSSASQKLSDGKTKKRLVVERSDSASIAKYGRLFMEIAEDATAHIDTNSEATNLADYALSDLSTPVAEMEVDAIFFPFVELGDLYNFAPNYVQFDAQQTLAVTGYQHTVNIGDDGTLSASTSMSCRGKPSGGFARWHEIAAKPGVGQSHQLAQWGGTQITATTKQPGGARLDIANDVNIGPEWDGAEIHVSTASGFTPDNTTLRTYTKGTTVDIGDLKPGKTYYARPVRRGRNGAVPMTAQPGPQISFTPAYLADAHFNPLLGHGKMPLNGGFESWFDGTSFMPDHWSVVTGEYGAGKDINYRTPGHSGIACILLKHVANNPKIRSALFPAQAGVSLPCDAWAIQAASSDGTPIVFKIEWYDEHQGLISTTTVSSTALSSLAAWTNIGAVVTSPAGTMYAAVTFETTSTVGVYVDDVSVMSQLDHLDLANIGSNTHAQIDTFIASKDAASGLAALDSTQKVATARLGTGSASSSTYLRGDRAWAAPNYQSAYNKAGAAQTARGAFGATTGIAITDAPLSTPAQTIIGVAQYGSSEMGSFIAPTLLNSWANYSPGSGGNWEQAGYWKDASGVVHIRGFVKSGTINTAVFTLPTGYRPTQDIHLATISNDALGKLQVLSNGNVMAAAGSNVWFSIHCSFPAEQ